MSDLTKGPRLRLRAKSRMSSTRVGYVQPEQCIPVIFAAAPGAVGTFVWVAPTAGKVVRIESVHDVAGAGSSKVYVRKHKAAQTAAANAAVSSTDIIDLVTGGIAADATVRVSQNSTVVSNTLAAGDKLAVVTPATWKGSLFIWYTVD